MLALTYQQSTGKLTNNASLVGIGYSGHAEHANKPEDQALHMLGPIPRGRYRVEHWRDDPHKGEIVCDLIPDLANEMFGRAGFMLHGDNHEQNHTASEGCIIQSRATRLAVRTLWARSMELYIDVIE